MTFSEYKSYFETILDTEQGHHSAPYDNPDYFEYTKLNWSRMNRWFKTGKLSGKMEAAIANIKAPQDWIIITEPWCGDAAHNIPFMEMMAALNSNVSISYQLRDTTPFLIDQYLTNGTKSIPKLIVRDKQGNDLAVWGPRPKDCQRVYSELLAQKSPFEVIKTEIQNWYNKNKGADLQLELVELFNKIH